MDDYRTYEMKPGETLCFFVCLAGALLAFGYLFYGNLFLAVLTPFIWKKSKSLYCGYRAEKRRNQLLLQFRDFLYSLSGSFAAGRHMEEALEEAGRNLADIYGDSMMEREIHEMICRIRETGQSELEAVEAFAVRSGLPDAEILLRSSARAGRPAAIWWRRSTKRRQSSVKRSALSRRSGHGIAEKAGRKDHHGHAAFWSFCFCRPASPEYLSSCIRPWQGGF